MARYASIDIGTNSVRLLVAELGPDKPTAVHTNLRITKLGQGLDKSGHITDEACQRTQNAVKEFADEARELDADITVFGTAAFRDADNGHETAQTISRTANIDLQILSGAEEAAIAFQGVAFGHPTDADTLIIDIGGGSTEFVKQVKTLDQDSFQVISHSVALGSVRHTERHLPEAPSETHHVSACISDINSLVAEGLSAVTSQRITRLYGVAGSVTQLAALELNLDTYDPIQTDGFFLKSEKIAERVDQLTRMTNEERMDICRSCPARGITILAGALILQQIVQQTEVEGVYVSEYDSLWGALALNENL